ncbi:MAG: VanW family protein [Candidatus Margulisiibacteriota bacterium]|nr:VanW family protein [Candidatus Margulisiibacteriota bacterium]
MDKFHSILKGLAIFALIGVLLAGVLVVVDYFKTHERFPPNTYIGNYHLVDVSGLTRDEAMQRLGQFSARDLFASTISFVTSAESFSFSPEELGLEVLPKKTVNDAFRITHKDNYLKELRKRISRQAVKLPVVFALDKEKTRKIVADLAPQINSEARDATITYYPETGGYNIRADRPARKLLVEETLKNAEDALSRSENSILLAIENIQQARIREADLRAHPPVYRLAAYTTYYGSHDSPNRIHNIMLMAKWINNTVLLPDEVFSLVDKIGDFSEERGFKEAYVISNGELVPELGGGACQIGTTLYNSVALADLAVLARRNHSFYFNIYPLGRDATIYPGSADFKFKNNTGNPVLIQAIATKQRLSFRIYGTPTGKEVKFSPVELLIQDPKTGFRPSSLKEVMATDWPFRTLVTRTVLDKSGNILEEEIIKSYYKLHGDKTNVPIKRPEPR